MATACPHCGATGIAPFSEVCPKCKRPFVQKSLEDSTSVTATRAGGLTGAVTATPGPTVAALFTCAAAWTWLGRTTDAPWLFALAALHVVSAMLLLTTSGPARHAPIASALFALALTPLTTAPLVVQLVLVGAALGLIVGTLGEPRRARIFAGGSFSVLAAGGALALQLITPAPTALPVVLHDQLAQVDLLIPDGWSRAARDEVTLLPWPTDLDKTTWQAFSGPEAMGVLAVIRDDARPVAELCGVVQHQLGLEPTTSEEGSRIAFEGRTGAGSAFAGTCLVRKSRFVAIVVARKDPSPGLAKLLLEQTLEGLSTH